MNKPLPPEFGQYPSAAPKGLDPAEQAIMDQQQMRFLARNVKTKGEKDAVLAGIEQIANPALRDEVKKMLVPLLPKFEGEE